MNADMSPVALFVFRRPEHTAQVLADLRANLEAADTPLYIFSDAAASTSHRDGVRAVRTFCRGLQGFARVQLIEHPQNLGCAASVIDGVSRVLEHHDRLIVVEDDLRLSSRFLAYMNAALDRYQARRDIFSVSAFAPLPERIGMPQHYRADVYLSRRNASWGWGRSLVPSRLGRSRLSDILPRSPAATCLRPGGQRPVSDARCADGG